MRGFSFLALLILLLPNAALARHHGHGWNPNPAPAPIPAPAPAPQDPSTPSDPRQPDDRQALPVCVNKQGDRIADPNNEQVLQWKKSTPNQYLDRGYVRGTLVGVYDAKAGHLHLDVFIGNDGNGTTGKDTDLEVIYNQEFGAVDQSQLKAGSEVIACGDYITSNKPTGHYPASPVGAILHWVHKAMNGSHPSGFLMIDGRLYGQQDAPPRGGHAPLGGSPLNALFPVDLCVGHFCN